MIIFCSVLSVVNFLIIVLWLELFDLFNLICLLSLFNILICLMELILRLVFKLRFNFNILVGYLVCLFIIVMSIFIRFIFWFGGVGVFIILIFVVCWGIVIVVCWGCLICGMGWVLRNLSIMLCCVVIRLCMLCK